MGGTGGPELEGRGGGKRGEEREGKERREERACTLMLLWRAL